MRAWAGARDGGQEGADGRGHDDEEQGQGDEGRSAHCVQVQVPRLLGRRGRSMDRTHMHCAVGASLLRSRAYFAWSLVPRLRIATWCSSKVDEMSGAAPARRSNYLHLLAPRQKALISRRGKRSGTGGLSIAIDAAMNRFLESTIKNQSRSVDSQSNNRIDVSPSIDLIHQIQPSGPRHHASPMPDAAASPPPPTRAVGGGIRRQPSAVPCATLIF